MSQANCVISSTGGIKNNTNLTFSYRRGSTLMQKSFPPGQKRNCIYGLERYPDYFDDGDICEQNDIVFHPSSAPFFPDGIRHSNYKSYQPNAVTRDLELERFSLHDGIDKILSAQWINDENVVLGTKCNNLFLLDLFEKSMKKIPAIESYCSSYPHPRPFGVQAVEISPSKSLLATSAKSANDLAVYSLPDFEPVCVGEYGHLELITDMKWVDYEYLVTASKDNTMCIWHVDPSGKEFTLEDLTLFHKMKPACRTFYENVSGIKALAYTPHRRELTSLTKHDVLHFWDIKRFSLKASLELQHKENTCMSVSYEKSLYAIGSQSHITLVDPRDLFQMQHIKALRNSKGIQSLKFKDDILSFGTGNGKIHFFDVRAQNYLNNSNETLKVLTSDINEPVAEQATAVYTHCYDEAGERIFGAGGPLHPDHEGSFAALWQ